MTTQTLSEEIAGFFDEFAEAFHTWSGARVAARYAVPGVALRGNGSVQWIQSRPEIEQFFQGALDSYRREGCHGIRYRDLHVVPMGGLSALGTVTWELLGEDGTVLRDWRQSYNLVRTGTGWEILVSTYHVG